MAFDGRIDTTTVDELQSTLSFAIDAQPYDIPDQNGEDSLKESLAISTTAEAPVTFEVLQESTQRGKTKLVDSLGYSYTVKVNLWCNIKCKTICIITH